MKALFWKEFRENRLLLFLGLGVMGCSAMVTALIAYRGNTDLLELAQFLYLIPLPIFGLCLGATMVSDEVHQNSLLFLLSQPIPRWKIWAVKFLIRLLSLVLFILISAILVRFLPNILIRFLPGLDFWRMTLLDFDFPIAPSIAIFVFSLATFTSSLSNRTMMAFITAILGAILIFVCMEIGVHYGEWRYLPVHIWGFTPKTFMLWLLSLTVIFALASLFTFVYGELSLLKKKIIPSLKKVGIGLLLLIILGTGAYRLHYNVITYPRELKMAKGVDLSLIQTEIRPIEIIGYSPSQEGSAAKLYVDAIALVGNERFFGSQEKYEEWFKKEQINRQRIPSPPAYRRFQNELSRIDTLPRLSTAQLSLLKRATSIKSCNWGEFDGIETDGVKARLKPPTKRTYFFPHFGKLGNLARGLSYEGRLYEEQGKVEEAIETYERLIVMGNHIKKGRESIIQILIGCNIEADSCSNLERLHRGMGNFKKAELYAQFPSEKEKTSQMMMSKMRSIDCFDQIERVPTAITVLKSDEDPLFRTIAVANLGYVRPRFWRWESHLARRNLRQALKTEKDPYVKEAVKNALKFSLRDYRKACCLRTYCSRKQSFLDYVFLTPQRYYSYLRR